MVKISGLCTVMSIVFMKYRLLNSYHVERMESSLTCLGANVFWRVTVPYLIKTSSFAVTLRLVLGSLAGRKMQISFKMLVALDNAVKVP